MNVEPGQIVRLTTGAKPSGRGGYRMLVNRIQFDIEDRQTLLIGKRLRKDGSIISSIVVPIMKLAGPDR